MREMRLNITSIKSFWEWFSQNAQNFGSQFDNTELLTQLDEWITQMGSFGWEIGPGIIERNALVISPGGDADLLSRTKEIISYAPKCPGWEYHYAKPPKQWDLVFWFKTSIGMTIQVDASAWEYVLLKYEDGMFTILIKAPQLIEFTENDKLTAAQIVLDGVIGEEMRMQKICEIEAVKEFEKNYQQTGSNIKDLREHIKTA